VRTELEGQIQALGSSRAEQERAARAARAERERAAAEQARIEEEAAEEWARLQVHGTEEALQIRNACESFGFLLWQAGASVTNPAALAQWQNRTEAFDGQLVNSTEVARADDEGDDWDDNHLDNDKVFLYDDESFALAKSQRQQRMAPRGGKCRSRRLLQPYQLGLSFRRQQYSCVRKSSRREHQRIQEDRKRHWWLVPGTM